MKELSIEQKLRDIEVVKQMIADGHISQDVAEKYFPELKEDEDELTWLKNYISEEAYSLSMDIRDNEDRIILKKLQRSLAWLERQGESKSFWKPTEEQYEALTYAYNICSDTDRGNYYEGVLETLIEDLHRLDEQHPKFKVDDIIHCKLDNRTFVIKEVDLKKGVYIYTEKGCGNDINYADEMFELVEPNPYSGTSFVYNNHTWGMCARDGGVDILCDSKLIKHVDEQKRDERKEFEFVLVPFGTNIKLEKDTMIIPDGYVATIDGNKIYIKKEGKGALEAVKEEKVDNTNKVEPKFHEGDWITDGNITIQIEAIKNDCYLYCGDCALYSTKTADKVYHLWTINDAKPGDIIYAESKFNTFDFIGIFYTTLENGNFWCYCDVSSDSDIYSDYLESWEFDSDKGFVALDRYNFYPATKKQRHLLYQKMKEAGYEWDAEKKELKDL